jgi:predicted extracellular nuclease
MTRRASGRPLVLALIAALAVSILPRSNVQPVAAVSTDLVISQVYGGGGNAGAVYTHDFIEVFNRGSAPVALAGKSLQYTSSTGTGLFGAATNLLTSLPAMTLQPGQYLLVQESTGGANGVGLPLQDVIDSTPILMSANNGKVALVNSGAALGCNGGSTPCSPAQLALIIDLVAYGDANFFEGAAAAPGLTSALADLRDDAGCAETDNNAADFTAATPTPRNSTGTPLHVCPADTEPSLQSSLPANGATNVDAAANISLRFSEAVDVTGTWFDITCTSGPRTATVSDGPVAFTLNPDSDFASNDVCTVTVFAANVSDQDSIDPPDVPSANASFSFTVASSDPCADPFTPIPQIQGVDDTADITGTVTTEGIVVSDDEGSAPALRGFYLQDPVGDGDSSTSDGIFVFNGDDNEVNLGDEVRVIGNASEFQGQTQISASTILDCGDGSVSPTEVTFPVASGTALEAVEGMLVRFPQTMYVTEHFQLGRFGQVVLSSGDRLQQPTAVVDPGAPAIAMQAANNLNKIILDDSSQAQNPDPIVFARGGQPLSATNTLRGGDTAAGIVGVMTYTWGGNAASPNAYRIRPLKALDGSVNFVAANGRPGTRVEVDGAHRVVGMNLLNYFNTFDGLPDTVDNCTLGLGGAATDCRGADTQAEFDRQWPKTVAAIVGLEADVIGVNEVENDGYGPTSAIADLVGKLNAATEPGTYAFIDVDAATGQTNAAGTDAIKVGIIYRVATVTPVGQTAALNSVPFVNGGDPAPRSRPSLAQAFETTDGARFIVDVNHLKSKGSACSQPDQGDGQGNCNQVRTNGAAELVSWLASDPTGTGDADILIVGDLNSYAQEDPVRTLEAGGFVNLVERFVTDPYSFVFDGQWGYLDYALGSDSAVDQVAGIVEWHINADEPSVLDYNTDFKTANLQTKLYAPDRFRVSDHDPIVVGLDALSDRPEADAGGPYQVIEGGSVQLTAVGSDPTGDALTYAWDFDGDGFDDGVGASVTFDASALQAPLAVTVTVRVTDEHGQSATDTATVNVIWDFHGFFGPVSGRPTVDVATAGSTIVAKFSLGGDQGLAILGIGYPASASYPCGSTPPLNATTPTTGPGLSYVATTGLYEYAWKTDKAWAGACRTFVLGLADGTRHYVDVNFRHDIVVSSRR